MVVGIVPGAAVELVGIVIVGFTIFCSPKITDLPYYQELIFQDVPYVWKTTYNKEMAIIFG